MCRFWFVWKSLRVGNSAGGAVCVKCCVRFGVRVKVEGGICRLCASPPPSPAPLADVAGNGHRHY